MDRSLAARPSIWSLDWLWRPLHLIGGLARSCFLLIASRRRLRTALLVVLVALALLAGGWLLLRKSSFVAVEHVRVSGLHGPQARAIETALDGAARGMSTLDVRTGALRAAVASFPVVRTVRAIPSFPHGLRIEVLEQLPVAALTVDGTRTAVAADGVVLGPALLSSALPAVAGYHEALVGARVQGPNVLAAVAVLGAAPAPLRRVVARVYTGPDGLTVAFRSGLLAYFGDGTRPHAKWLSLARILADPSSAGASYIDVRLPERPAAGFPAGGAPSSDGAVSSSGQSSTPESTVAALAAGLSSDTSGGSTATSGAAPASGSTSTTETSTTEASSTAAPEATAPAASSESSSTSGAETSAATSESGG
jgi:cell division protein FtsQ